MIQHATGEIARYFDEKIGSKKRYKSNMHPVSYFQFVCGGYPVLYKVALDVLSIPASSAGVERLFSAAGLLLSGKRMSLDPMRVNKMVVIKQNWDDKYYNLTKAEAEALQSRGEAISEGKKAQKRQREGGCTIEQGQAPPNLPRVDGGGVPYTISS